MTEVTERMAILARTTLRYLTMNGKTRYDGNGNRLTPTYDEAVTAARELCTLLSNKPETQ